MISMETRSFSRDEWNNILSKFEELSLMQTWEYGEVKTKTNLWEVSRCVFLSNGSTVGAAQAMIRFVPFTRKGLVWINRGPLWRKNGSGNISSYVEMLKQLRAFWVDEKKMYLKIAPPLLESEYSRSVVQDLGFSPLPQTSGWASEIIDLAPSEEQLKSGLKQKWRNCLNKAYRLGVECIKGNSNELLSELLFDYKKLLERAAYRSELTPEFITQLQNLLPADKKMLVLAGRMGKDKLGSILVVPYGKICMYLIGAVNEVGKKSNASYLLLWDAICDMKRRGYKWFDVGGADPARTPKGILHFKRGLGGTPYQLIGEIQAYKNNLINNMIRRYVAWKAR